MFTVRREAYGHLVTSLRVDCVVSDVVGTGSNTLIIVALILALGVAAQVLADRFRVPSVLFLILAGVAMGPEGLAYVTVDTFGD